MSTQSPDQPDQNEPTPMNTLADVKAYLLKTVAENQRLREELRLTREALAELHAYQNGCPLSSYETEWTAAMKEAERILGLEYIAPPVQQGEALQGFQAQRQDTKP